METTSMPIEFIAIPVAPLIFLVLLIVLFNLFCVYSIIDEANSDSARATTLFTMKAIMRLYFQYLYSQCLHMRSFL